MGSAYFWDVTQRIVVDSSWNVMAHGDTREGNWRGNWRMEQVASTLHTTSERGVSSITNADAHTSAASSRLNWRPCRFKWTCPFRRKTKSGFCACTITFQPASTSLPTLRDVSVPSKTNSWISSPMKMGPIFCSEISVRNATMCCVISQKNADLCRFAVLYRGFIWIICTELPPDFLS